MATDFFVIMLLFASVIVVALMIMALKLLTRIATATEKMVDNFGQNTQKMGK